MNKSIINKRRRIRTLFLILGICIISLFVFVSKKKGIILYVNNEAIYEEEIMNSLKAINLQVRNNLMTTYKIDSEKFSWDTNIDGNKKALDFLKEKAINMNIQNKVLHIKAKENNLIDDIDYNSIRDEFEKENNKRESNRNNNKIVYGNVSFNFRDYYDYMNNNLTIQLKKSLKDSGTLKVTESEAKSIYKDNLKVFQLRKEGGEEEELSFDNVKSNVIEIGLNEKFNKFIESEVGKASIKVIDERRLEKLIEKELA